MAVVVLGLWWPQVAQGAFERSGHLSADTKALASMALIKLPAPPVWDAAGEPRMWTVEDIEAEFARVTDTPPVVNHVRRSFLVPEHGWLNRLRVWFGKLEGPLQLRFEDQVWDCDNYAGLFVCATDLVTLRAGETRAPLAVGWAAVYYRRPFAGIESGVHAVVVVVTSTGLHIIEPQDGTMVPLRDYPNRDTIDSVYF